MKKILVILLFLLVIPKIFSISVEIEFMLDPPENEYFIFSDSLFYMPNGELVVDISYAFNLFVLRDGNWVTLITEYREEVFNTNALGSYGSTIIYLSETDGEYFFERQGNAGELEYYRIFVNEEGETAAQWVSEEYFEEHKDITRSLYSFFDRIGSAYGNPDYSHQLQDNYELYLAYDSEMHHGSEKYFQI